MIKTARQYRRIHSVSDCSMDEFVEIQLFVDKPMEVRQSKHRDDNYAYAQCFTQYNERVTCYVHGANISRSKDLLIKGSHVMARGKMSEKFYVDSAEKLKTAAQMSFDQIEFTVAPPPAKTKMIPAQIQKSSKWFGLEENEVALMQTLILPENCFVLPQVQVGKYRVDFVVFSRRDAKPLYVIEIDGSSHDGKFIQDHERIVDVCRILGIPIERVIRRSAKEIFEMRRRMSFIPPEIFR